jgi:tetratricopeptide (TPR) repeat protein
MGSRPGPDAAVLNAIYSEGLSHHQAGRLDEARQRYEQVLAVAPRHFDALHLLGVCAIQTGQLERGVELIRQAISVRGDMPGAYGNLANALNGLGRHAEALEASDRAIALNPDFAEAHGNRAQALQQLGRLEDALASYDRVVALKPTAKAYFNQATLLRELGRPEAALASCDRALALEPGHAEGLRSRGVLLCDLGRLQEGLESYDRALAGRPDYAEAWCGRGMALQKLGRPTEAVASQDQAINLRPTYAEAHNGRGGALYDLRRLEEALESYDRAVALKPDYAEAHNNRGVVLSELRRLDEAMASYDAAIALRPDFADAQHNQALCRLLLGDYEAGWAQYEWRWRTDQLGSGRGDSDAPTWLGQESLAGRTLLLRAEQGLGDTLQFCRYAPEVAALGAKVILEVQPGLERLAARLSGVTQVVTRGQPAPAHDVQTPLLSLPLALGARPGGEAPYLRAESDEIAAWSRRLTGSGALRIGLCWAGGLRPDQVLLNSMDARRSLSLEAFAPLAGVEGLEIYSLQKGPAAAQLAELQARNWAGPEIIDLTAELKDFADTAALVANLDLMITCDTAVAHLAGGLGKPVWILNRFDGCWRWLDGRADTPWYPSARLFNQPAPGDWTSVIGQVVGQLHILRRAPAETVA